MLRIPLMKQLATPLSNQKTVAKWLVIFPTIPRKTGEGANVKDEIP